jgi:hypothetical protein
MDRLVNVRAPTVERRSSSTAVVRVALDEAPRHSGSVVFLLVRNVACSPLEAQHRAEAQRWRRLIAAKQEHAFAKLRTRAADVADHHTLAETHRENMALTAELNAAGHSVDALAARLGEVVSAGLSLEPHAERLLPHYWMVCRGNVLLGGARRRLALAKLSPLDGECARRVATTLTALELSLHSDITTGSFVPLTDEMLRAPDTTMSALQFEGPDGKEASILLCGLAPHTQFQTVVRVMQPPSDPVRVFLFLFRFSTCRLSVPLLLW